MRLASAQALWRDGAVLCGRKGRMFGLSSPFITRSMRNPYSRRSFLRQSASALALLGGESLSVGATTDQPWFKTRGVVLFPFDLSLADWPVRAKRAGLTHIALHAARRLDVLVGFVSSEPGRQFLRTCRELGLAVEYELHAMGDLLSRELYLKDQTLFRQDETGKRNADFNCCPSSRDALEIIAERAVHFSRLLRPTTHRYYYWSDDGRDWCRCPSCRELSASEQALLVENRIVRALRAADPFAQLSHLAYQHTMSPPRKVKPEPGVFLEFAPIARSYTQSIAEPEVPTVNRGADPATHGGYLDLLEANLACFGTSEAQVLEYWLDVSRFSGWTRPAKKLPWRHDVFAADLAEYRKRGIRHVTSFAAFIDADYVKLHGEPSFLDEYGSSLSKR
jgi:hypothetical protein